MPRLTRNIALIVFVIPSFGMAGVMVDSAEFDPSVKQSISTSLDGDQTPAPSHPEQFNTDRNFWNNGN